MSEPGLLSEPQAIQQEKLWDRAPAWRGLTMIASVLTLAALATPLLVPQPVELSPPVAASHIAAAPQAVRPATPAPAMTLPAPQIAPQPQATAPVSPHIAALPPAVQPAAPAPAMTLPAPQIAPETMPQPVAPAEHEIPANLPVGTIIVPSGVLTRVNRHAREGQGQEWPVTITVVSQPAHGTVTTQFAIGPNRTANGTRIGNGTVVYYQSNSGYTGMDTFTYRRTSGDPTDPLNNNVYTMTIAVN